MTSDVTTVSPDESLNRAAQLMWEHDCGCLPVVDADGIIVGMLTDRDICMAAYTQGRPLSAIPVGSASAKTVVLVRADDTTTHALELMGDTQVRRLPVVDDDGRLVGIITLSDLARPARGARHAHANGSRAAQVTSVLEAVSRPRRARKALGEQRGRPVRLSA